MDFRRLAVDFRRLAWKSGAGAPDLPGIRRWGGTGRRKRPNPMPEQDPPPDLDQNPAPELNPAPDLANPAPDFMPLSNPAPDLKIRRRIWKIRRWIGF